MWLVSFAAARGLVSPVVSAVSAAVLVQGALYALAFPLGYATVGLFLACGGRQPIGWLFAAPAWSGR